MRDREQELLATLRKGYEAVDAGDFDAASKLAHPDIEFVRPGGQHALKGREAFREWMEPDAFEEQHNEVLEMTAAEDKVLVSQRVRARGAGSGIEIDVVAWVVWTFDDAGLVTRIEAFLPHEEAEARKAAGLAQ